LYIDQDRIVWRRIIGQANLEPARAAGSTAALSAGSKDQKANIQSKKQEDKLGLFH
jgi:hypothetical protein